MASLTLPARISRLSDSVFVNSQNSGVASFDRRWSAVINEARMHSSWLQIAMKGRRSTRQVGCERYAHPANQRFSDSFATETPIVRGCHSTAGPLHAWRLLRAILDPLRRVLDMLVGAPRIRLGISPPEEHPGWNIEDQVDLTPHAE